MIPPRTRMVIAVLLLVAGCRSRSTPDPAPAIQREGDAPGAARTQPIEACGIASGKLCPGETLETRVLAISREYARWSKLDVRPRWAPMPCAPTWEPPPGDMYMGEYGTTSPHHQKLYYLYARDSDDYTRYDRYKPPKAAPPGQVIVKESFLQVEVPDVPGRDKPPPGHARWGNNLYRAGDPVGIFVMAKLDRSAEGTDEGWVYGVVAPGGAKVEAGKLQACMGCHRGAPRDRLFGFHRGG
ncbi:MAG: cytochrome P460 family protein [Minicystis sp.]